VTKAPIQVVAALREVLVLFAVALAMLWLKEPFRFGRIMGAGVIAWGSLMRGWRENSLFYLLLSPILMMPQGQIFRRPAVRSPHGAVRTSLHLNQR
jgi:drug/metabolite transporter (DMT)-like permease